MKRNREDWRGSTTGKGKEAGREESPARAGFQSVCQQAKEMRPGSERLNRSTGGHRGTILQPVVITCGRHSVKRSMGGLWYSKIENNIDKSRHFHLGLKISCVSARRSDLDQKSIFKGIFILNYDSFQISTAQKHNLSQQDSEAEET